ncbi:MAG: glycoside hydrolase family 38 C-terminal domain-containing protein [Trueperaceae bacterium]
MTKARTLSKPAILGEEPSVPENSPASAIKEKTLHMIGNAHIDPVWLWQWQEGYHEVLASFRSALDRLEEYDGFIFVSSSAAFYQWVEKSDPEMFEEIRRRVHEGRWEIVGGWWIQPDCNIPNGESFVRQALYAQRYFLEKFGVTARVGYNVDSFGHHAMLPQLLKKSGLEYYVFMRPSPHEKGLPGRLFWWESDDGSRVLAYRIPFEYGTWGKDLEKHVQRCVGELREQVNELMCFYGVGNHGGGPTKENIDSILRLREREDMPKLEFSSPNRYFEAMAQKDLRLPVVHEDLQHHASGCYAAHSGVKRWNRRAENLLATAEKLATLASQVTGQALHEDLAHAWKGVLFNQFHDILAGTSLEDAYEDARDLYGEAMAIGSRALNEAMQALAWNIDIPYQDGVRPLVVFNQHGWRVNGPVEIEIARLRDGEVLIDESGNQLPLQVSQSAATAQGRQKLLFAVELPALGYRTFRLVKTAETGGAGSHDKGSSSRSRAGGATAGAGARGSTDSGNHSSLELTVHDYEPALLQATECVLENERFRLEVDPETGWFSSLRDKDAQTEVLSGPAARPVVIDDPSDTWGHNVFSFTNRVGEFRAISVKLIENGPVRGVLRIESRYGESLLVQDVSMYRDRAAIDVSATVDWREPHKMLKLRFPTNLHFMRATFETPYGHIERFANEEEKPGQSWVDLSGTARDSGDLYGLSILNDSKYSFDVNIRDIGLTVLRNPVYAHHIPAQPESDGRYSYTDQGVQRFRYTLLPHSGGWGESGTVRRAVELNARPLPLLATFHPGPLPQRASYLTVDCRNVDVSVLKPAEDGAGVIVRAFETSGNRTTATIRLPAWQRTITAEFGPSEIKTFLLPATPQREVLETDLIERPLEQEARVAQPAERNATATEDRAKEESA